MNRRHRALLREITMGSHRALLRENTMGSHRALLREITMGSMNPVTLENSWKIDDVIVITGNVLILF